MDHKVLWCFCYPFITRNVRPGRKELAFTRRNYLIASVVSFTYRSLKARSHHLRAMLFCLLSVEIVDLPGRLFSFVSFSNSLYHSLWQRGFGGFGLAMEGFSELTRSPSRALLLPLKLHVYRDNIRYAKLNAEVSGTMKKS